MLSVIDPMSLLKWMATLLILMKKTSKLCTAKVCLTSLCYILVGLLTAITTHAFFSSLFCRRVPLIVEIGILASPSLHKKVHLLVQLLQLKS